jgi:hypothetical protein
LPPARLQANCDVARADGVYTPMPPATPPRSRRQPTLNTHQNTSFRNNVTQPLPARTIRRQGSPPLLARGAVDDDDDDNSGDSLPRNRQAETRERGSSRRNVAPRPPLHGGSAAIADGRRKQPPPPTPPRAFDYSPEEGATSSSLSSYATGTGSAQADSARRGRVHGVPRVSNNQSTQYRRSYLHDGEALQNNMRPGASVDVGRGLLRRVCVMCSCVYQMRV